MNSGKELRIYLTEKKKKGEPIYIAYLPAAYPNLKTAERWINLLFENGVDAVELGFPSDFAEMDGQIISEAHQRVKENGFKEEDYLKQVEEIYDDINYLIVMGYWNELHDKFRNIYKEQWINKGLKYLLFPDLDLTNEREIEEIQRYGYRLIPFISQINEDINYDLFQESPFIYCPAYEGQTGKSGKIDKHHLIKLKQDISNTVLTNLPALVGFGISNGKEAASVIELGYDGIIIGTAMLKAFQDGENMALALLEDLKG